MDRLSRTSDGSFAAGDGLALTSWSALGPGETADPSRSGMGESLFPAPGDYEIVMTHGAAVVAVTIHVLPRPRRAAPTR